MRKVKRFFILFMICLIAFTMSSCKTEENRLIDGYYTAEMSEYNHGWKEFLVICVSNGKIVTVEYNARNESGFIKAWDLQYMRNMNGIKGTYPNRYTRTYAASLLKAQADKGIDTVSGATSSGGTFQKMAELLLKKAKAGDTSIGIVKAEE